MLAGLILIIMMMMQPKSKCPGIAGGCPYCVNNEPCPHCQNGEGCDHCGGNAASGNAAGSE